LIIYAILRFKIKQFIKLVLYILIDNYYNFVVNKKSWNPADVEFKNVIFATLDWEKDKASFSLIDITDVLHKYMIFDTIN